MIPQKSTMLRSCGFAVCMWLFLATSAGQPNAPTQLSALPRYSTPVEIVVLWQDNSNDEDGFRIERREEGTAAWTFWTTVPAGAGAGQREWIDSAADEDTYWEYRVCATSAALGNSAFTTPSYPMIRKQLWPIHEGGHDILHSFGTPLDFILNLASDDPHITNAAGRMAGLVDLFAYPYVTYGRDFVGAWSHMSDKAHDVHVMGWEKWRAGWIDETGTATSKTITHVDKPAYATPIVNQSFTLLPLNNNLDGTKAVAIEIGDGLHYTAEYRRQDGLDNTLPDEGVLVVKANDCIKQGEGPAIVQNATVTTAGLSQATYTTASERDVFNDVGSGVNIEVTSMNANQAEIRLNYQVPATENDVYVSPHDDRWEALDIWVDAPTLTGDFEANPLNVINANEKPVVGSVNMVYGRVRNQGHADAANFEVHLEILEPWGTGSTWHTLKIETVTLLQGQDHASNDYYLISSEWTPTAGQHTCVKLKIRGVSNDVNLENNWTQENINQFTMAFLTDNSDSNF